MAIPVNPNATINNFARVTTVATPLNPNPPPVYIIDVKS